MEDLDDEIPLPDKNGILNLSKQDWVTLDDKVWNYREMIIILDLSYNNIQIIPSEIGYLVLLRELNIISNKLESLPNEIGRCICLRILKLENNKLKEIPIGIQWCKELIEIYAANNCLNKIPKEIKKLQKLKIFDIRNNQLEQLPETLCECSSLETLRCEGNELLEQIPEPLRENTPLVLWICQKIKDHTIEVEQLKDINNSLEDMARISDEEKMKLKDEIMKLEYEKKKLLDERPDNYLKLKEKAGHIKSQVCSMM